MASLDDEALQDAISMDLLATDPAGNTALAKTNRGADTRALPPLTNPPEVQAGIIAFLRTKVPPPWVDRVAIDKATLKTNHQLSLASVDAIASLSDTDKLTAISRAVKSIENGLVADIGMLYAAIKYVKEEQLYKHQFDSHAAWLDAMDIDTLLRNAVHQYGRQLGLSRNSVRPF